MTVAARPSQRCAAANVATSGTRIHSPASGVTTNALTPSTSNGVCRRLSRFVLLSSTSSSVVVPGAAATTIATTSTIAAYAQATSASRNRGASRDRTCTR